MPTTGTKQNIEKAPDEILKKRTLEAVAFLKASSIPNIALASEKFDVPYDHLHGCINRKSCRHNREGPNGKLIKAQGNSLCAFFEILDNLGLSPRLSLVENSANKILVENYSGLAPCPTVGDRWPCCFREHHPEFFKK